ncbi:BFH_collapsed_G0022960.mRNA.1.CDS.1 [Saccharomyces cerevisiae]|nr:BFH_collapsed_G0022960.mRNA.1.CDS.1 [Saccharomyces cerevisiae]
MLGTWPLLEEEKQLVYWIRQEASKGSQVFRMSGRQIKELYYKVWSNLRESKTEGCCSTFELGREKVPGRMGGKRRYGLCGSARESWSFSAFAFHDERWTAGSAKLEYLLEQISEVWLLPHWLDLANVEVLAADNTKVPLYMLMVAVHKELDSDDVPDGRFDILLCSIL